MKEKKDAFDSRTISAAIIFFVVLLGLGIPVWWYTTAVHRAHLPELDSIDIPLSAANQKVKISFRMLGDSSKSLERLHFLESLIKEEFSSGILLNFQEMCPEEFEYLISAKAIEILDRRVSKSLCNSSEHIIGGITIMEVPQSLLNSKEVYFGHSNHIFIAEQTSPKVLSEVFERILKPLKDLDQGLERVTKLSPSSKYNILITLATSNPASTWNIESIVDDYLDSFLKKLNPIANLTVLTQVIYVGDGQINADFSPELESYILKENQVATLINALEPKLGTHLSANPTFHWVYYLPHAEQSPLKISFKSANVMNNAVRSPRWNGGGLQIINSDTDLRTSAGLLIAQLRNALGLSSLMDSENSPTLDQGEVGISDWELQSLIHQRTIYSLNKATSTLKSLYQSLSQIENIVVSEAVKDEIVTSLLKNTFARQALLSGDVSEAYRNALVSVDCAEKAFFFFSLLSLLYFPDDQKYAIYIPLFLPVGIPVLLSLRSVIKYLMYSLKK